MVVVALVVVVVVVVAVAHLAGQGELEALVYPVKHRAVLGPKVYKYVYMYTYTYIYIEREI